MGYTHYFRGLIATPQVIAEAAKIIEASGVTVCGPRGEGLPVLIEAHGIKLNGFAAAGEAYETFSLPSANAAGSGHHAWFCKTENKPYDVVVTAILTAAALHRPGVLRSDGRWENWTAGLALYEKSVRFLPQDQKIALELDIEAMRPAHR
ncbi:hypothetical protein QF031_002149 [Pseudarthrobacter defluvii]|uniref:hypothetical protein n=1 Tax=Pseudarthrobacter defluvii TaxID=410837 RepID=UPI00277D4314|nr:hypothetical protein [Pseudarthrobacter defluvii]MDQ0769400.1 hypothetical protein [Pseudarthrobacter defluvii]